MWRHGVWEYGTSFHYTGVAEYMDRRRSVLAVLVGGAVVLVGGAVEA